LYENELAVAIELARETGEEILRRYTEPIKIESKIYEDKYAEPVTEADRVANEMIVNSLRREFPDDGILAEESVDDETRLQKNRVWMIDPIDGTSGFIERNGDFAVQIGLAVAGESVLGVVYQPFHRILYRAVKEGGCWVEYGNTAPTRTIVSAQNDFREMTLAVSRSHRSPRMSRVVETLDVKKEVQRGSVGVKVGLIVSRDCDLYIHLSPRTKEWDTCAPEIILREAGGGFTDIFGRPFIYNKPDPRNLNGIAATNGVVHQNVIERLSLLLEEFERKPA